MINKRSIALFWLIISAVLLCQEVSFATPRAQRRPQHVYKLMTMSQWHYVQRHKFSPDFTTGWDKQVGRIKLATKEQIALVWAQDFPNEDTLMLVTLDYQQLERAILWKSDANGDKYPYYPGVIHPNVIRSAYPISHKRDPR